MTDEVDVAVDNTATDTQATDYKALYEEANAKAEKYQGYFKKEKAKQKTDKSEKQEQESTVDVDELRKSILDEVSFYGGNPKAAEFKEDISGYVSKGLSYEDAYSLVASKKDPMLLVDQQTINKNTTISVDGLATDAGGATDFTGMSAEQAAKLPDDQFDEYWKYKKSGGK